MSTTLDNSAGSASSGPEGQRLAIDPRAEIEAMDKVSAALMGLSPDQQSRVLTWAAEFFKIGPMQHRSAGSNLSRKIANADEEEAGGDEVEYRDFPEFFDAANPATEADRALVAGYWLQERRGQQNFKAQEVNTALKDLGHGIGNVTDALSKLIARKPNEVMQTAKRGTSQQARKTYRVTKAGINVVERMVANTRTANDS